MLRTKHIDASAKAMNNLGANIRENLDAAGSATLHYARRGASQARIGAKCVHAGARAFLAAVFYARPRIK